MALSTAMLVLFAVATIYVFSVVALSRNTLDHIADKSGLLLDLVGARIQYELTPVYAEVTHLTSLVKSGQLDLTDERVARATISGALVAIPQIWSLTYWHQDGPLTSVLRNEQETATVEATTDSLRRRQIEQAGPQAQPYWGETVYIADLNASAINLQTSIWMGHKLVGGISALIPLASLSRDLLKSDALVGGLVPFAILESGAVIAHPQIAKGLIPLSADRPAPDIASTNDDVLAEWIRQKTNSLKDENQEIKLDIIRVKTQNFTVRSRLVEIGGSYPVRVGVYINNKDTDPEIQRLRISIIVGLLIVFASVAIASVLGHRIGRPIQRLALQAARMGSLDFSGVQPLPRSYFSELDDQSRAFNRMLASLRWFEAYVPKSVVRILLDGDGATPLAPIERTATIMFTDIDGFTAMTEDLSASAVSDLLNTHFKQVTACIEAHGGVVDKYIGDGVMAAWNGPEAMDGHAAAAVQAAQAIAATITADNIVRQAMGKKPILMRIGIHSGPVVIGNIGSEGRLNYTIVGDAVNTTQRIESISREIITSPVETAVLISAETVKHIGEEFPFIVKVGEYPVKGKTRMVTVYSLREVV